MKDAEFIELLNLYLDHEISPEDSARLEAEVQKNPQRRRIYQDYCRMQRACVVLAQESAVNLEREPHNVVSFETPSRAWRFGSYAAGLCAAAACVALIFVAQDRSTPETLIGESQRLAVTPPLAPVAEQTAPVTRALGRTVSVPSRRQGELKPVFAVYTAVSDRDSNSSGLLPTQDARFDWMNHVHVSALSQVPVEDLVFKMKSGEALEIRALSVHQSVEEKIERSAYQFSR